MSNAQNALADLTDIPPANEGDATNAIRSTSHHTGRIGRPAAGPLADTNTCVDSNNASIDFRDTAELIDASSTVLPSQEDFHAIILSRAKATPMPHSTSSDETPKCQIFRNRLSLR